ncbi:hypothetical protein [Synechococcus phage S-MS29]|jgi:acyl-CoA thioesterase|nr:hypothetical protein [Synechococcus phage S-MS29]|tara:strand:+ start:55 stop:408 length:354 start_codon:yes stop_codon:yes gene_type:complete
MPSEIAQEIVDKIFGDSKQDAMDAVNDALASKTVDLIQAKKLEFAASMGFNLDDTGQDAADAVADALPDGTEAPEDVEVDGRLPEEPPADEVEVPTAEVETEETPDTEEETTDETDQ